MIASRTRVSISVGPTATLDIPSLLHLARPLPLWLRRADGQPRVAAGLRQRRRRSARHRARQGAEGARAEGRRSRLRDAGLDRRLRRLGPEHDRSVADGLRHRLPDACEGARLRGATRRRFTQALDRLQNFIAYAEDFQKGGEDRAYALYVLARNGRAPIGDLRYYADTRLDRFSTPLAKAQLGAALAMMGDKTACRDGVRRRRSIASTCPSRRVSRLSRRLRLRPARQRRAADAGLGDRVANVEEPKLDQRHRQGLRRPHLHVDAGAGVDAAGRQRAWRRKARI